MGFVDYLGNKLVSLGLGILGALLIIPFGLFLMVSGKQTFGILSMFIGLVLIISARYFHLKAGKKV